MAYQTDSSESPKKGKAKPKDEEILAEAQDLFRRAVEADVHNRDEALDDWRFARLGEQWPEAIRKQRELEGRPVLTINRMPAFIRQVVNDMRMNRPSIQVHPVDDGSDPATAKVLQGLIRNIEVSSNADVAYDTAGEAAVTGGFGWFRIVTDYAHDDTFDLDICIKRIENPFTVYGDPASTEADSSDWNHGFVTELMTRDAFTAKYPKAEQVDWDSINLGDNNQYWMEGDMVRVAEYWCRKETEKIIVQLNDGQVMDKDVYQENEELLMSAGLNIVAERQTRSYEVKQYILSGAEVLESNDWPGRFIPIVPVYGEAFNIEGKRWLLSLIRFAKDPQRMFNYWRTTTTELVALAPKAPFIGRKGAFNSSPEKWASANTQTHAYLEYDGQEMPQRQPFVGTPPGTLQEALNASDDMKSIMGMYDASLGARSNETSGRAIMARQREGDVGTFHFADNLARALRHAGKILIDLIPHIYSTPRVMRILGEDNSPQVVRVNQTFQGQDGVEQIYDLGNGKYDVTVTVGPSFTTKREEAATQMIEFMRTVPAAGGLIGDMVAKNLDWPGAEEIAQRLKAMLPPQLQDQGQNPQLQQAEQAIEMLKAQLGQMVQALTQAQQDKTLEIEKIKHDAGKLRVDEYNAETNRLKVMGTALTPEQVTMLAQQATIDALTSMMQPPMVGGGMPPNNPFGGAIDGQAPPPMPSGMGGMSPQEMPPNLPIGAEIAPPPAAMPPNGEFPQ